MNNVKWIVVGVVSVAFIVALTFESTKNMEMLNAKYDTCVNLMNEVIPDPNDDSRASYLQNCYEQ